MVVGVVVTAPPGIGVSFRAHIEWQYENDPAFRDAWFGYMRANAKIRGDPGWGRAGAWTPTQIERVRPLVNTWLPPGQ